MGQMSGHPDARPDPAALRERTWVKYIEGKYGVQVRVREAEVDLEYLLATQGEIEKIKYLLVRDEAYRAGEPILAYQCVHGTVFVIDGHTRARVEWDAGRRSIPAYVLGSPELGICEELDRIAAQTGGGSARHIWEVPIIDRLGEDSDAWKRRRKELLERVGRSD